MINHGRAVVIIDGQWGSCGKGKVAAEVIGAGSPIDRGRWGVIHVDFQPNAGHTWVSPDGKTYVTKILPSSAFVEREAEVVIGPTACFDPRQLQQELGLFEAAGAPVEERLVIDPMTMVLQGKHRSEEENTTSLERISSTRQGVMAAAVDKMRRGAQTAEAFGEGLPGRIEVGARVCQRAIRAGKDVMLETAQGFDLSLNHGLRYPYTTSRDIHPGIALAAAGLPTSTEHLVVGCLRTYPIRVGAIPHENNLNSSGPYYPDQVETTWGHVSQRCGRDVEEKTTVTQRVRRVFTFSNEQLLKFCRYVGPDFLYLNFANYLDGRLYGQSESDVVSDPLWHEITRINDMLAERELKGEIRALGTGPNHGHCIWIDE